MDDLTAFVTARLDEDGRGAQFVKERESRAEVPVTSWLGVPFADRMLREVEAKRQILVDVKALIDGMDAETNQERGPDHYYTPTGESDLLLKLLALPYSGHPDYRPEWKP